VLARAHSGAVDRADAVLQPAGRMRSCARCHSRYCAFQRELKFHMFPSEGDVPQRSSSAGGRTGALPEVVMVIEGAPLPSLQDVERRYIVCVLQEAHGNQLRAARILGISRWSLARRLRKYGLPPRTAA